MIRKPYSLLIAISSPGSPDAYDLLINKLFLSQIAKVAVKLRNKNISCVVSQTGNEKLEYIISCLKLANINITEQSSKISNNDGNQKIIAVLTEKHLLQLKQAKKIDNTIFICFDKRLSDDFLQKFSYIQIVDCFEKDQIYSSIFKIIELLAPNIDLHDSISSFNKQKKIKQQFFCKFTFHLLYITRSYLNKQHQ